MNVTEIIRELDSEISQLKAARALLTGTGRQTKNGRRRKRKLSAEGRARIAAAVKRRWAAVRKAAK